MSWLNPDRSRWAETLRVTSVAADALPVFLQSVQLSVEIARREYHARAFSPFWDAVQGAMKELGHYYNNVQALQKLSLEYETFRQQQPWGDETFPDELYRARAIPDPRPLVREYEAVVRLGLSDLEFSIILEHRRMQESPIAGFATVGDAITRVGQAVANSFAALAR
jgi:hypothetical protein